jgi:hypothetical protein
MRWLGGRAEQVDHGHDALFEALDGKPFLPRRRQVA